MTPSELKQRHEMAEPESHFFSRETMKFFGDKMSNFGCYSQGDVWVLYRKKPVKHDVRGSWFFDKEFYGLVSKTEMKNREDEKYLVGIK